MEIIPKGWEFQLIGHVDRVGYPYWVIPLGMINGEMSAIYNDGESVQYVNTRDYEGNNYYDVPLLENLSEFNFRRDVLFAYSQKDVTYHNIDETESFVDSTLSDSRLKDTNHFMRLSISHGSRDREIILKEMVNCLHYLSEHYSDDFVKDFYDGQIEMLKTPRNMLGLDMPEFAKELDYPGTLESLLT